MTNHDQQGVPVDTTEALVREQFEGAVAGLHLDVPSLVAGGTGAGHRLRRRRRLQQAGAGVASAAVIAAGGLFGFHGGLFGSDAAPPADNGRVSEEVPTTARALAAIFMSHLPSNVEVLTNGGTTVKGKAVEADFRLSDGTNKVDIGVAATTLRSFPTSCPTVGANDCHVTTLADGSRLLTSAGAHGTTWTVFVILERHGESVLAVETAPIADGGTAILLSTDQLVAILQDPLFGMETSQRMVDAGDQLQDFLVKDDVFGAGDESSGSSGDPGSVQMIPPRVHREPTRPSGT